MRAHRPPTAVLFWQAWRWAAFAQALARRGTAFLPRALEVDARSVVAVADRRKLFRSAGTRRLRWLAGSRVGGDWDLDATPVVEHAAHASFALHFFDGIPWEDVPYRRQVADDVARGVQRIGCRTAADVERKFRSFDRLWEALATPAYRAAGGGGPYRPWEEVLLGLDRAGGLVLVDGRHRLILAHLKSCRLPAYLVLRHREATERDAQSSR